VSPKCFLKSAANDSRGKSPPHVVEQMEGWELVEVHLAELLLPVVEVAFVTSCLRHTSVIFLSKPVCRGMRIFFSVRFFHGRVQSVGYARGARYFTCNDSTFRTPVRLSVSVAV